MKEIVIKIPEDAYDYLINTHFVENTKLMFNQSAENRKHTMQLFEVIDAVKNGTPLPKGHGRLIDEKDLSLLTVHLIDGMLVCDAPTIIEAEWSGAKREVEE
jgi:hypothetical protein